MTRAPKMAFDVGGTFTDVVVATPEGGLRTFKLLSIPERVAPEVRARVTEVLDGTGHSELGSLVHGTTIGSNALLEGTGAVTDLITTRGFRDELELRRLARPGIYDYLWERTPPLIARRRRREVTERMTAQGEVFTALDEEETRQALLTMAEHGVESLAICLINAYVNPAHEEAIAALARELLPEVLVSTSSTVLPEIREHERMSTTSVNAYLMPVVTRYLDALERELRGFGRGLRIMQSNGGVMTATHARAYPVYVVESGPAAGVVGTAVLTREVGIPNAVSFDLGGTTVKACLIENSTPVEKSGMEVGGGANVSTRYSRGTGYVVSVPSLDIVEAGAGGGSIAWIDPGGALRVGPRSASAVPGPACYGSGGAEPTITDANVILGYMNPESIAGGTVPIDRPAALSAFERVLCPHLGMSAIEAAHGVHTVANAAMMRAIRAVTTERGHDPRDFALIAFGGAGPIHAAGLAANLGMRRVYVPLHPGLFSALGLLLADVRYDYVQSIPGPLEVLDVAQLEAKYEALAVRVRDEIEKESIAPDTVRLERFLDLRYRGQTSELTLKLGDFIGLPSGPTSGPSTGSQLAAVASVAALAEQFHAAHERAYGYNSPGEPVVVVNLRMKALAPSHSVSFAEVAQAFKDSAQAAPAPSEDRREAYFGAEWGALETRILARSGMIGHAIEGPAIVEEFDTTVVIPPGWSASLDDYASMVLDQLD